jgi:hypothetical protein
LALAVLCAYFISVFFQNPFIISLYYATSFASALLGFIILLYLRNRSKEWNWQLEKNNLMFWVSVGLFVFHIFFPVLFLMGYLNREVSLKFEFQMILRIIIVIMYTLFCIGFVISRRRVFR